MIIKKIGQIIPDKTPGPEETIIRNAEVAALTDLLGRLDSRTETVIRLHHGITADGKPRTHKEVGATLGLGYGRVGQIYNEGMRQLRKIAAEESLAELLVSTT